MFVCWSVKGGSGTTVVAASLALTLSSRADVTLVDLRGDVPAALGAAEPAGPGVSEWLASPTATAEALWGLAVTIAPNLRALPWGAAGGTPPTQRWHDLAEALGSAHDAVVVDAGGAPAAALLAAAERSVLVTRACYLSLRRCPHLASPPTDIVLVKEPGRALGAADIERAVGAPVVAEVPFDPAIARAIDAGLLSSRLPLALRNALRAFR